MEGTHNGQSNKVLSVQPGRAGAEATSVRFWQLGDDDPGRC